MTPDYFKSLQTMKLIKTPLKRLSALFYIKSSDKEVDKSILTLSKYLDIYVYVSNKSGIDPLKYSLLLPISGYSSGSADEVSAILNLIRDINVQAVVYEKYLVFNGYESPESVESWLDHAVNYSVLYPESPKLRDPVYTDLFSYKRFDFNFISESYKKKFYFLEDHRLKGSFCTYTSTDSYLVISSSFIRSFDEWIYGPALDLMKTYYFSSFSRSKIGDFIPSSYYWMDLALPSYDLSAV